MVTLAENQEFGCSIYICIDKTGTVLLWKELSDVWFEDERWELGVKHRDNVFSFILGRDVDGSLTSVRIDLAL